MTDRRVPRTAPFHRIELIYQRRYAVIVSWNNARDDAFLMLRQCS